MHRLVNYNVTPTLVQTPKNKGEKKNKLTLLKSGQSERYERFPKKKKTVKMAILQKISSIFHPVNGVC